MPRLAAVSTRSLWSSKHARARIAPGVSSASGTPPGKSVHAQPPGQHACMDVRLGIAYEESISQLLAFLVRALLRKATGTNRPDREGRRPETQIGINRPTAIRAN